MSASSLINDWPSFSGLVDACKSDVLSKLDTIADMLAAPRGQGQKLAAQAAAKRGVSKATINRELSAFRTNGWRGLIDERRFPESVGLPETFKDHVRGLFDAHQRQKDVGLEVHRKLLDQLRLWRRTHADKHAIPGYSEPPANMIGKSHPAGWSYKNILRLRPAGRQAALTKQGRKAAADFLPSVLTTRQGSFVLQRIYFDDQDYDNKIAVAGLPETARPVGFNALDHLTASHLGYHLRLLAKLDGDDKSKKSLTGKEFTWFALHLLQTVGYRTDEHLTRLVFEHGTANSWNSKKLTSFSGHQSFETALKALTKDQVGVDRSGKFNDPVFAGMLFRPQSTGNFRYKTWIESAFKLVRTYMQALPGPTGLRYQLAPEELHGIEQYERQLIRALDKGLTEHQAELLHHELLTYPEFAEITRAVYRAINHRSDHALEGWEELGFTRALWRHNEETELWFPRHELNALPDPDERAYIARKLAANPHLVKYERLSPHDALALMLDRDKGALTTLDDSAIPLLIPREWAVLVTIRPNQTITLQDPFFRQTRHQYITQLQTRQGHRLTLNPGTELLAYFNPFNIDRLPVCTPAGEFIGTLSRSIPRQVHDTESVLEQLEVRSQIQASDDAPVRARAATIAEARQTRREHNRRVIDGEELDPAARRSQAARKASATRRRNRLEEVDPDLELASLADLTTDISDDRDDDDDSHSPSLSDLF